MRTTKGSARKENHHQQHQRQRHPQHHHPGPRESQHWQHWIGAHHHSALEGTTTQRPENTTAMLTMAMVSLANSDFGRILFGTLFLGKLKETGEFKDARVFLWKYVYFLWMCETLYKFVYFFASDDAKLSTKFIEICGSDGARNNYWRYHSYGGPDMIDVGRHRVHAHCWWELVKSTRYGSYYFSNKYNESLWPAKWWAVLSFAWLDNFFLNVILRLNRRRFVYIFSSSDAAELLRVCSVFGIPMRELCFNIAFTTREPWVLMTNKISSVVQCAIGAVHWCDQAFLWSILVGKTCGVLTVLMSKTLDNINVDWHNLILSRLCKLDTCAIDDKILPADWQLSCWERHA